MKYLTILACTTLLALPALAQTGPYPLGTLIHDFQLEWESGKKRAQGWDPTFYPGRQTEKDRLISAAPFETFPVGLPNGVQPGDLGNTHCPVTNTIDGLEDVVGLPVLSLSGVSGPVYLISGCNRLGSSICVGNDMQVAIWGSAFGSLEYSCGSATENSKVFAVDSVFDAGHDDAAGVRTGPAQTYLAYTEVLGGNDSAKLGQNDVYYKVHLHAYDRDSRKSPGEHNDTLQAQQSARDYTVINSTLDGPFQVGQVLWAGYCVANCRIADSLIIGGESASIRTGSSTINNMAIFDNQVLADQRGSSFLRSPCQINANDSPANYQGEGNTATDGSTSGPLNGEGKPWGFGSCNREPVSRAHRDFVSSTASKMETWVNEIRAAAGAPSSAPIGASISVATVPSPAYSATDVTVSGQISGCSPAFYEFECGDGGSFDDGGSVANFKICGKLAPGTYDVGVRASGGTCDAPVSGTAPLTVFRPPAPVMR